MKWTTSLLLTLACAATASAQVTLFWDTDGANPGTGGTGTWLDGGGNWSTDSGGTTPTTWTNANRDTGRFEGTPGTVTTSGVVETGGIDIRQGSYSFTGSDITFGRSTGATNNYKYLDVLLGTGTTTFDTNFIVDDAGSIGTQDAEYTADLSAANSTLVLNGNITLDYAAGPSANRKVISFTTGNNTSEVYVNGSVGTTANGVSTSNLSMYFGQGGTNQSNAQAINGNFYVNSDNSDVGRQSRINGGTVYAGHDNAMGTGGITFGTSGSRGDMRLLTNGERTISNNMTLSGASTSQTYVGGGTADDSTFSGSFNMNGFGSTPNPIFTAAAGGRVEFSGNLFNSSSNPRGTVVEGPGVVAFSNSTGNNYKGETHINSGTLLLMNLSGSATGDGSALTPGDPAVFIADGARLGGTGITTQIVMADAVGSIVSAGDMTKDGISAIGELTFASGMVAPNGLIFEVDIDGASIDVLDFGAGDLDMDGLVTFSFNDLGSVNTGVAYELFEGTGDWSGTTATFDFISPDGYMLDTSYGGGNGFIWDAAGNSLSVQFQTVVPEPTSLSLLGLAALGLLYRRRR